MFVETASASEFISRVGLPKRHLQLLRTAVEAPEQIKTSPQVETVEALGAYATVAANYYAIYQEYVEPNSIFIVDRSGEITYGDSVNVLDLDIDPPPIPESNAGYAPAANESATVRSE